MSEDKKRKPRTKNKGSFKEGNEFWKLRSKHGRDRIIKDPEALLESAYEYFDWCTNNPLLVTDYKGTREIEKVHYDKPRPFTKEGVALYCGVSAWNVIAELKKIEGELGSDFIKVITHIETIIYKQKFEWASIGVFNSNIIARDLGLSDKSESKSETSSKVEIKVDKESDFNIDQFLDD